MKLRLLVLFAVSLSTAFAGTVTYTNYSAWLAATPGEHDAFGAAQDLGQLAVTTQTGIFGAPRAEFSGSDVWNDRLSPAGEYTTFYDGDRDAAVPFYAFGAYWDMSVSRWGNGLHLALDNGVSFDICGDPVNLCGTGIYVPDGAFFGVITTSFSKLTLTADSLPGTAETFDLSALDMVHGSVPEPATFALLGAGLLAVGLFRKRSS